MHTDSWQRRAACAPDNRDEDELHLDWYSSKSDIKYDARAICRSKCDVRKECLQAALKNEELWGIWGGVDDYELRRTRSVDSNNEPLKRDRPPRCPFCLSRDLRIAGQKTKSKGYLTECLNSDCNLVWYMAVIPDKYKKRKAA